MTDKEMDILIRNLKKIMDDNARCKKEDNKITHSSRKKYVSDEPVDIYVDFQVW